DLIRTFPSHKDAPLWKGMIKKYSRDYLMWMSRKNSFGIVPFGLYANQDPGGNRRAGKYWYRYFMQHEQSWWVGVNSNLASSGIGVLKAARVLNDPELKALAQRQLDWITGVNPFNSSTIEGVGYNQPKHFPGSTFKPQTPVLPGAVLNGLGGDHEDQTAIGNGDWQISEYWTPMVAYTVWLMAELSGGG
ncbi:MAG TPA: glycoside hydrolase family 9 protein, partial [Chryseosolibacter sp.]